MHELSLERKSSGAGQKQEEKEEANHIFLNETDRFKAETLPQWSIVSFLLITKSYSIDNTQH